MLVNKYFTVLMDCMIIQNFADYKGVTKQFFDLKTRLDKHMGVTKLMW